jgi:hypothetical protein
MLKETANKVMCTKDPIIGFEEEAMEHYLV